jgi:hypothetical protein
LSNSPGTLSGVVTDPAGQPLAGVTVFVSCCGTECVSEFMSDVTDAEGRYLIGDLKRWKSEDTQTFDPKTQTGTMVGGCYFRLSHPDYALTTAKYTAIPQQVNVQLKPPAVFEGKVIDEVTGKPLADVPVFAQGVARHDSLETRTDGSGRYRLLANKDHFNIWAEADERIAIAAKAVPAVPGKTARGVDVRMVRGGFVVGMVRDGKTENLVDGTAGQRIWVAHHGPARPRTGAAVTSTAIGADGSYRLRVAPGRNYIYLMGGGTAAYVDVTDGAETKLDLRTGEHQQDESVFEDPDFLLGERLRHEASQEVQAAANTATLDVANPAKPSPRKRADTAAGRLLDKLEQFNAGSALFSDTWLRTLKAIVALGPDAVPDLIAELDNTNDDQMLRCCGFALRAIGDRRAVPALIRAIPKTLRPAGSDMGLLAKDAELARWAQQHDLDTGSTADNSYGFGRPVREIFGALESLTGQKMREEELYHVFLDGLESQRQMKRELFHREAKRWADWWEANAGKFVQDPAYARAMGLGMRYKTSGGNSNWVLESIYDPKAERAFFDLDTSRAAALPEKWRGGEKLPPLDEILAWAREEGFDLMGTEHEAADGQRYYALRGVDLKTWELPASRWKLQSNDITVDELRAEGRLGGELLFHVEPGSDAPSPQATAPFLFLTREGTPGLLFVGIEVKDDSLKPGGIVLGDSERDPVAFNKGRRFAYTFFEELNDPRK